MVSVKSKREVYPRENEDERVHMLLAQRAVLALCVMYIKSLDPTEFIKS